MGGVHVRRSAKTGKKAEAQAFLAKLMEEHALAARGEVRPRHRLTEALSRFLDESALKQGTIEGYRFNARTLTRLLGDLHLDEIDRRSLAEFVTIRKRTGVTDATIRRDLAVLGSVYTTAIRWGWADTSPVTAFNKRVLKLSRPRTRFLSREEFARLHKAASDGLKPILVLAVETGMRKAELLGLTVGRIDLRRREVHLEDTKSGTPRRVPLSPRALETIRELLERRSRPCSCYLFCKPDGSQIGNPKKAFEGACRRAGVNDFHYHDLRHTFASWWVQDGGDLYRLSRILGHTTLQMSSRYAHLRTNDLHEEIERVAQKRAQEHINRRMEDADR